LILFSVVALVLLIGCANVANLVLARTASRQRELSLRAALGASRARILRQLLTESLVLAVLGAGAGLAVAFVVNGVSWRVLPTGLAQLGDKAIDLRVLGFTGLLAVGTAFGFGMLPAFRSLRADVRNALRSEDRAISGGRSRMRMSNGLVAFEVAIGVVVAIGAGLLARSFWELINVDSGFQTDYRLTALVRPIPRCAKLRRNAWPSMTNS
jgi:putative ABC transport system permease protein